MTDKLIEKKRVAGEKKRALVRDRRRFKETPVPTGTTARSAPAGTKGTLFPGRVVVPSEQVQVLKDGANSCKIGGDVLKGRLKGARIVTLTLEERATCPASCALWLTCYGNGMQYAQRFEHGEALMQRVAKELRTLCAEHEKVLVRLHVLGDFWSSAYVRFWSARLALYPNLYIFGFTAHRPESAIGAAVVATRSLYPDRFMIRHSGMTGQWGSFTINFPTDRARIGDAIVCPEQKAAMSGTDEGRHCGNCGLCWATRDPIVFIEH